MSTEKLTKTNPAPHASAPREPSPSKKLEVPVTNDLPYEPNAGRMEHDRNS